MFTFKAQSDSPPSLAPCRAGAVVARQRDAGSQKVTAYLEDLFVHGHDEAEEEEVHLVGGEAFHFLVAGAATTAGQSVVKIVWGVSGTESCANRHGCLGEREVKIVNGYLRERELNPVRERELKTVTGVSGKRS